MERIGYTRPPCSPGVCVCANAERPTVEFLESHGAAAPALILPDINMPRMNGHQFLEAWYRDQNGRTPVVVMLTSSMQESDKQRASQYRCERIV